MPPRSDLLQTGVAALKQQRFAEAVQAFEASYGSFPPGSKEAYQLQMYLVRAYQENGQSDRAINLCQLLANAEQPQVRSWAERTLPILQQASVAQPPPSDAATSPQTAPTPGPQLTLQESANLLSQGNKALKTQQFAEAVAALETYCTGTDPTTPNYAQGQMWLVKAYNGNGQSEAAVALCHQLLGSEKEYVQIWAQRFLEANAPDQLLPPEPEPESPAPEMRQANGSLKSSCISGSDNQGKESPAPPVLAQKAGRSNRRGITLPMRGVAASLSLASGVTVSLLFGMILVLCLSLLLIVDSQNPTLGLIIAVGVTILVNTAIFFIAPFIMDLIQGWLYGTRWTSLAEIDRHSPEAGRVIRDVCQQKKLSQPRLGIIDDDNPTAFTYGSLPNSARLVVSRGIFRYLDDDEVATVYAHELGHIVHWDFAVMTLASTLVQITYLIYVYIQRMARHLGDGETAKRAKAWILGVSIAAYLFYVVGEYLLLYLSRTREYYADHFAAEVTGNPNGLSRALVKIAYGLMEEGKRNPESSKVLAGTRALGIADPRSATFTGTAYRAAAEPRKVGRVFLWDLFNPWAWWMELNSTHPLTGKRVRALTTYAEHLGLETEFEMAKVMREGRLLNKQRLYGSFVLDVLILWADWIGLAIGLLIGGAFVAVNPIAWRSLISGALIGFGMGTLLKMVFMYPDFKQAPVTDVLTLMSDPYASPLRGRPVKLQGEIIGRGDSGYRFGSDLKLQDPTGLMYLYYSSRFGPLGNFLFGMSQAESFVRQSVTATGWFRRGLMPWVDLVRLDCDRKWPVHSYHRFWHVVLGVGAILLGFAAPVFL